MTNKNLAPIILFVYNRPEHTRKTVEALQKNELANESLLFVFADGPKTTATPEQLVKVQETRDYIHTITGFKEVIIYESEQNKGLANSVISGVTKVINEFGRVIVVEDDIVTHPYFLRYMNDCLDAYDSRHDIFMIGGYGPNIKAPWWYRKKVFLSHRSCSWGWATWKNRWNLADWEVKDFSKFCVNKKEIMKFTRCGDDMFPMLQAQMAGKIDSWAIRWDYCMYKHNALCVRPLGHTLCINDGMDGTGVHCGATDRVLASRMYSFRERSYLVEPNVRFYKAFDKRLKKYNSPRESRIPKYYTLLRHYIHITRVALFKKLGL